MTESDIVPWYFVLQKLKLIKKFKSNIRRNNKIGYSKYNKQKSY